MDHHKCIYSSKCYRTHSVSGCRLGGTEASVVGEEVNLRVVTLVKFRQEICGARRLSLAEVAHHVGLLLPDVDGLLQLHLTLSITEGKRFQHTETPL